MEAGIWSECTQYNLNHSEHDTYVDTTTDIPDQIAIVNALLQKDLLSDSKQMQMPEYSSAEADFLNKNLFDGMEPMQIPEGIKFTKNNFINRDLSNDRMPLMPKYNTLESRINSFHAIDKECSEELLILLAKTGFYYPLCQVKQMSKATKMFEQRYLTICFCCGSTHAITSEYPIRHYLSCKFFTLPEEIRKIKVNIKPFRGIEDMDWDYINKLRQENNPGKVLEYVSKDTVPIPLCEICNVNQREVLHHPCLHVTCITCAKRKYRCSYCGKGYTGLSRYHDF